MKIEKFVIKRYRSINNMIINFKDNIPLIISWSNNVWKTNFLRALNLYFSLNVNLFDSKKDIPFDIEEAKRWWSYNTNIIWYFTDNKNKFIIELKFKKVKGKWNILEIKWNKNKTKIYESEARNIIEKFRFLFIESSNINIPKIIDEIIDDEILPLWLSKTKKQTDAFEKLKWFIDSSKKSVESIEKNIEKILNDFIINIPWLNSNNWKIKILFPEYEKLREALSWLVDFTLFDWNDRKIDSKWSWVQRIILLSLMKYISQKSKKTIIWWVDEPESFLQSSLQKKVFEILKEISLKNNVIITTHSQNFIDINNIENTYLFKAKYEIRPYARKKNESFYKVNTFFDKTISISDKLLEIKSHLWIASNDWWHILPKNIIVEWEEDKIYLEKLANIYWVELWKILVAWWAWKVKWYLQFLKDFCKDLKFKPKFVILFDYDSDWKKEYWAINKINYNFFEKILKFIPRFDWYKKENEKYDYEIEDFIFPELIIEATNIFLKSQSYNTLQKKDFSNRTMLAYDKKCILNFLSENVKTLNPQKKALNFEDTNGGFKKIICNNFLKVISKKDISELDIKYPEIKKFLIELVNI